MCNQQFTRCSKVSKILKFSNEVSCTWCVCTFLHLGTQPFSVNKVKTSSFIFWKRILIGTQLFLGTNICLCPLAFHLSKIVHLHWKMFAETDVYVLLMENQKHFWKESLMINLVTRVFHKQIHPRKWVH